MSRANASVDGGNYDDAFHRWQHWLPPMPDDREAGSGPVAYLSIPSEASWWISQPDPAVGEDANALMEWWTAPKPWHPRTRRRLAPHFSRYYGFASYASPGRMKVVCRRHLL